LDGGQLIYILLVKRFTPEISAKILEVITIITALPIFFIGIMVMLNSKYNFSLLFIGIYLILSLFIRDEKYL
jgi:stage IV sporulation protein FB